ncbi:MAG: hypothetical protein IH907_10125 [Proteobacteria bacterium]|nr:hypothetical protein [Pseudomonadota bacterium]
MIYIIPVFGSAIFLSGAAMLVRPDAVAGFFRENSGSLGLHVLAVLVRLILGAALIGYATDSKYPVALQIFGWLSVGAAIILGGIGRSRFKVLISWALNFASSLMRFAGLLAVLLGGFLIYAVV